MAELDIKDFTQKPANNGDFLIGVDSIGAGFKTPAYSVIDVTHEMFIEDAQYTIINSVGLKLVNRFFLQGYLLVTVSTGLNLNWSLKIKEAFYPPGTIIAVYVLQGGNGAYPIAVGGGVFASPSANISPGTYFCPINWALATPYLL
jgi:hypothetical protein